VARQGRGAATNRRLTKAERKEDARLRREELQRQMVRRRRNRRITAGVAIVAAGALAVGAVFIGRSNLPSPGDLLKAAKTDEKAAGCGAVSTVGMFDPKNVTGSTSSVPPDQNVADLVDRDHIGGQIDPTPPPLSAYPSIPPASGPHVPPDNPGPLPAGVYDSAPDVYRVIHSLEHGAAVVWYSPNAGGGELQQLKDFYDRRLTDAKVGQDRVIVAPYDYPTQGKAGQLPSGEQMALVAWHRLQTCASTSLAAAYDFTSQYTAEGRGANGSVETAPPGRTYAGEAPEAGAAL